MDNAQHSHAADPGLPQAYNSPWKTPGGLDGLLVMVVGIISITIVFVIIVASDAWYRNMRHTQETQTSYHQMDSDLKTYLEEEHRRLNTPHYTQDDKKLVAIPIDKGMDAYLQSKALQSTPTPAK